MMHLMRCAAVSAALLPPVGAAHAAHISTIDASAIVSSDDGVDAGDVFEVSINTSTINTGAFSGYALVPSMGSATLDLSFEALIGSAVNASVTFEAFNGSNVLSFAVVDTLEIDLTETLSALFLLEVSGLAPDPVEASLFVTSSGAISVPAAFGSAYIQQPPQDVPVPAGAALVPAAMGCLILLRRRAKAA